MKGNPNSELLNLISNYIYAKDGNKPHLMARSFAPTATLEMKVDSENISFPQESRGLEAISRVLVSEFSQRFENVYTFCFSDSVIVREGQLICDWLVVMTDKESGDLRIGQGSYEWHFTAGENIIAEHLTITIEQMNMLSSELACSTLKAVNSLPYPWCNKEELMNNLPSQH